MRKINEKGVHYGSREKMPMWYSLVWSGRGVSFAIAFCFVSYLTYYCTDMLGLSAMTVGTMLVLSTAIDAVTDLIAGFVVDKTHTKIGKARPYEIFIVFLWLFTAVMFNAPHLSEQALYVFIFILYVLINAVSGTMLGASDPVYMARCFTTEKNRTKAATVSGVIVMVASIAFSIWLPLLFNGVLSDRAGWAKVSIYIAIPMIIIGSLRFLLCKEVVPEQPAVQTNTAHKEKTTIKSMMRVLLKNKYILLIMCMNLICGFLANSGSATTYYFKYIIGDTEKMSLLGMTSLITPFVIMFFPVMSKKWGTSGLLRRLAVIGIIGYSIRILGGTNMATLLIGTMISSVGTMPITCMISIYIMECMDYGFRKTGVRVEGLMASMSNFSTKVGKALASGCIGLIMGLTGYDGAAAVQTQGANAAIVFLFLILPVIMLIIYFIVSLFYDMDKQKRKMEV